MPFYDYYCEANGRTVEVMHSMDVRLSTWGEVCQSAGIEQGSLPATTSVTRLVGTPVPVAGSSGKSGCDGSGSGHGDCCQCCH